MKPDLKILADKKDDLLLAEIGAWLHDMGKCSDEMIISMAKDRPADFKYEYKKIYSSLVGDHTIDILGEVLFLKNLIELARPGVVNDPNNPLLIRYLGRCHAAAHIEKEGQADSKDSKQTINDTRLSSPLGFETSHIVYLTNKLINIPFDKIKVRSEFLKELKEAFKNAPGDTQRPINEIDLWDWSSIVAALYKSTLVGALLGSKPEPNKLKWRLLAIRANSEQVWGNASKIPVLLARKEWLTKGFDNVKKLLEEEYPMGNEVYRDENGSIFVVPDIPDLLNINDSNENKNLEELISEHLGYEGEIVVTPNLDSNSWWGQDPARDPQKDEIPPIGQILSEERDKDFFSPADAKAVQKWWISVKQNPEICTISRVCPQGQTELGLNRKASDFWAEKVTGRAKDWIEKDKIKKTIWIDEVADNNGRICLIVGKIDLKEWLKPEGYIKTLLVKSPEKGYFPKTTSFARIYRLWETSKTFWEDIENNFSDTNSVGKISTRIRLIANYKPKRDNRKDLIINSAYSVELEGIRFSIFCSGDNEFFIIENLPRLANLMRAEKEHLKDHQSAAIFIGNCISSKKILKIFAEEKSPYVSQIGELTVNKVEFDNTSYEPAIPILAEPSIFMAIVPANKALIIAKSIKDKYEEEMNKVRNRLPLTIGLVFAKSHTPISSIIDAGRRMLKMPEGSETWKVESINTSSSCSDGTELTLEKNENRIKMNTKTVMGDKTTFDVWYPYWKVECDSTGGIPSGRTRQFIGHEGKHWVHVCDLQNGDQVEFMPSRFDFEFLDSAARRFEISYKSGKRRDYRKRNRPYYLEDFSDFEELWSILKTNLMRSQIKGIIGLIETKRDEWSANVNDETFRQFVHNVIHNANWKKGKPLKIEEIEKAAISGKLNDIVELYMYVMKEKEEDLEVEELA